MSLWASGGIPGKDKLYMHLSQGSFPWFQYSAQILDWKHRSLSYGCILQFSYNDIIILMLFISHLFKQQNPNDHNLTLFFIVKYSSAHVCPLSTLRASYQMVQDVCTYTCNAYLTIRKFCSTDLPAQHYVNNNIIYPPSLTSSIGKGRNTRVKLSAFGTVCASKKIHFVGQVIQKN